MSADSAVDSLETSDSGFVITKQLSRPDGEHIQVDLEITSTHDEQSTVEIEETVPPNTDQSQVGFLPDNEPREWSLTEDGRLRLQARLVAEGTRQIVYGVRDVADDELEALATEPRVVAVGGPAGIDQEIETEEPTPAATGDEPTDDAAAYGAGETVAETPETSGSDGTVKLELPLDDETAATLADQLEPHLDAGGEMDAVTETKLSQLQEDVADMRAYLPAFEEFLGETGRADDILDRLDDLQEQVEEGDDVPEGLAATIEDVEAQLESLDETAEDLESQLDDVTDRLAALEDWRGAIAAASQPDESAAAPAEDETEDTAGDAEETAGDAEETAGDAEDSAAQDTGTEDIAAEDGVETDDISEDEDVANAE
jgi:hypothetical protein